MSPNCGLIKTPNLTFSCPQANSSSAAQKRSLEQCYARFNHECTQQDSIYCDSPLAKNFMLTILASNAISSSTKVLKFPHTKNDSIFIHNGLII
ncbi:hypothetical protein H5410_004859 [Solanum commersonii]|uniref:Uncharacterized protein n=1 Tax=Solanum commersonii TaxID=4109 RepID=A0A9J6A514_SOLCO|nr:hypothetical protein H5410_004859 [Solanum commersonii]